MLDWFYSIGRVLIPVLFIVEGVGQLAHIADFAQNLQSYHWPLDSYLALLGPNRFVIIASLVVAIEIVGGLLLLVGYQARWPAAVLAVFTIGTIVIADQFWQAEGQIRAVLLTDALKNLAIVGGLLMVVAKGAGLLSIDHWRRRY